jgi:hypothetical protein
MMPRSTQLRRGRSAPMFARIVCAAAFPVDKA